LGHVNINWKNLAILLAFIGTCHFEPVPMGPAGLESGYWYGTVRVTGAG
jgi:hypothetical protein